MARLLKVLPLMVLAACVGWSEAYSSGAILSSCIDLYPGHGYPPQDGPGSYSVVLSKTTLSPGEEIEVTLKGNSFKGFIIRPDVASGFFSSVGGHKGLSCESTDDAVTHKDNTFKTSVTLRWKVPPITGNYVFNSTVVVGSMDVIHNNIWTPFSIV